MTTKHKERIVKRLLLILGATVAAGGVAAAPAVAGLAGNPSFSHQIPVRAPSQAQPPQLVDDHGRDEATTTVPAVPSRSTHPEPGDDRSGATRHPEPGDDRGGATRHPSRDICQSESGTGRRPGRRFTARRAPG